MINLNVKKLINALRQLNDVEGIPYADITEASGVHNIGRIKSGEIEPTPQSWWKLHKAYPNTIPQPEYTEIGINHSVVGSNGSKVSHGNVTIGGMELTPAQEKFFRTTRQLFTSDAEWEELLKMALAHYSEKA